MTTINDNVDGNTKKLLNKVTQQINIQNQQIFGQNVSPFQGYNGINQPIWTVDGAMEVVGPNSSPNIDMEKDIYKNEFEECGNVEIGNDYPRSDVPGLYTTPLRKSVLIGLIDEVSEDEDDLYAKLFDGEIVPFKGHTEKFSVEIYTWNDLHVSDLIGSEVKKAATCHILINDRLARIIEGADVQDLLMKADRAIDELKVQPFSICRDAYNLIGREIYYDNQPAIINNIDELNNFIYIIPDSNYLTNFTPPPYALEDDEFDEWTSNFGQGMLIRDYDEKIWWWRNSTGNKIDPITDPYYKQFPQPLPQPPIITPNTQPISGPWAYPPQIVAPPYTSPYTIVGTSTPTITWTATAGIAANNAIYSYTGPITNEMSIKYDTDTEPVTITAKEQIEATTPEDLNKIISAPTINPKSHPNPNTDHYYNRYKTKKVTRAKPVSKKDN